MCALSGPVDQMFGEPVSDAFDVRRLTADFPPCVTVTRLLPDEERKMQLALTQVCISILHLRINTGNRIQTPTK